MIAYYGWRLSHDLKKKGKEERDKKKKKRKKKKPLDCVLLKKKDQI